MEPGGEGDKRDVRRPMNAFLIFCKRHRSIVREKNPDLDNRSVTRILGDLWANLKDQEKAVYTDLAKQYKDAFMKANPDYKWHNPEKAAGAQKPHLPKPTNAKVMRNDLDMMLEGSIMPGKLADPSNMGGLSLLLMAGQQSDVKDRTSSSPEMKVSSSVVEQVNNLELVQSLKRTEEKSSALGSDLNVSKPKTETKTQIIKERISGLASDAVQLKQNKTLTGSGNEPVWKIDGKKIEICSKRDGLIHGREEKQTGGGIINTNQSLLRLAEMCSSQFDPVKQAATTIGENITVKPLLYQAVAAPKVSRRSLLAEAFLDTCDRENYPVILRDNSVSAKGVNVVNDNQVKLWEEDLSKPQENHLYDEKENISKLMVADVSDASDKKESSEDESAMITCGKLVVNHIIDRLFSSDVATAARKMANNRQERNEMSEADVQMTKRQSGKETVVDSKSINTLVKTESSAKTDCTTEHDSKSEEYLYDEHDGKSHETEKSSLSESKPKGGKQSKLESIINDGLKVGNKTENEMKTKNDNQNKSEKLEYRKRSMSLSYVSQGRDYDGGDYDNDETEDFHPVRKSRRRNRGQRYQELINEGIIQPSKERMAALHQHAHKDEGCEEDFQSIDTNILPETAMRRIRKRTTSESAKDKLVHPDDVKRYKTGDFDLEAHIATLPACPVESMGRKRGFVRQRHYSECTYLRKTDEHPLPVFDLEKTVSLPPHVKIPSPEKNAEPVVGSRKRKARKHSITHLLPAPTSSLNSGNVDIKTETKLNEKQIASKGAPSVENEMKTLDVQMVCNSSHDLDTFISDMRVNGGTEVSSNSLKDKAKRLESNENKIIALGGNTDTNKGLKDDRSKYKHSEKVNERLCKQSFSKVLKSDNSGALNILDSSRKEKRKSHSEVNKPLSEVETGSMLCYSSCDKIVKKTENQSSDIKNELDTMKYNKTVKDCSGFDKCDLMDDDETYSSSGKNIVSAMTSHVQVVNQSKKGVQYSNIPVKTLKVEGSGFQTDCLVPGSQSATDCLVAGPPSATDCLVTSPPSATDLMAGPLSATDCVVTGLRFAADVNVKNGANTVVKPDIDMNSNNKVHF